ncbi:unnamed protein product (macronuclear) [Paramecium tetraurelia]|uniref:Uncharacterized protein n=1 Tax=Paramecium tetraurelia TaxID=5888 RepID=A0C115_PARTE|nr:uncharacterized protein GSPATT00033958001 [Paramecium tetraurelia]CAK64482.1 unnamed protein product [Paramecium tetraurelia]|eukprot:XP_001431880.1 hypothetical protein (macronuclear) [Paramecium tetraurelia strain d4-2]
MKQFKVSCGFKDAMQNQSKDAKSCSMKFGKVQGIHSGIDENNLQQVNQHLINHFSINPIVNAIEQPNNPLQKIRNRSKNKVQSQVVHSYQQVESFQNSYQSIELLDEKNKEVNYYKNHIQQLTEKLQKLTEYFETVKNENQSLKNQVDLSQNYQLIISNQQQQILKLQQDNVELEMILKNALLQQERQKFQQQSTKQTMITKKNQLDGQKLKLFNYQSFLSEQMNNSNRNARLISCPDEQRQKSHNEPKTNNQSILTLPDYHNYSTDQQQMLIQGKENRKTKY